MERNTDLLEGLACPACAGLGPFWIGMEATYKVSDGGYLSHEPGTWTDSSYCACEACGHASTVEVFSGPFRLCKNWHLDWSGPTYCRQECPDWTAERVWTVFVTCGNDDGDGDQWHVVKRYSDGDNDIDLIKPISTHTSKQAAFSAAAEVSDETKPIILCVDCEGRLKPPARLYLDTWRPCKKGEACGAADCRFRRMNPSDEGWDDLTPYQRRVATTSVPPVFLPVLGPPDDIIGGE